MHVNGVMNYESSCNELKEKILIGLKEDFVL